MENWSNEQWILFVVLLVLGSFIFSFYWNGRNDPPSDIPGGDGT